jgi:hypothetical protein
MFCAVAEAEQSRNAHLQDTVNRSCDFTFYDVTEISMASHVSALCYGEQPNVIARQIKFKNFVENFKYIY